MDPTQLGRQTSAPRENGNRFIKEGLASILVAEREEKPPQSGSAKGVSEDQLVFYNPIQQFNRDLTVLVIKTFGDEAILAKSKRWEKRREGLIKKTAGGRGKRKRGDEDGQATETRQRQQLTQQGDIAVVEKTQEQSPTQQVDNHTAKTAPEQARNGDVVGETAPQVQDAPKDDQPQTPPKIHFRILDALSATGLRAIRYAKEIPMATSITANDLSSEATKFIRNNVHNNDVEKKIEVTTNNAQALMYSVSFGDARKRYDVIDIDPYGSAAPFFDSAVQALNDGGLLCITCTDPSVFASVGYPEKCFALYGGVPMKGPHSHEGGLRIVLHAIAASAARYGLAIEPLLSLSIDYYVRIFVRVRRSPAEVKFLAGKSMLVYSCDQGCGAWTTQLLVKNKETQDKKGDRMYKYSLAQGPSAGQFCEHCGFKTHLAGPMYAGSLHSTPFVQKVLSLLPDLNQETYGTIPRIEGMLTTALEEDFHRPTSSSTTTTDHTIDSHPRPPFFFFMPNNLAKVLHCSTPTESAIRGALMHLGYQVTRSHARPGSIKTDAPWSVIWRVMREWVRQKAPIKEGAVKEGSAGWKIIHQKDESEEIVVEEEVKTGTAVDEQQHESPSIGAGEDGEKKDAPVDDQQQQSSPNEAQGQEQKEKQKESKVIFDEKLGAAKKFSSSSPTATTTTSNKRQHRMVRYQINPRANWGPMNRAKGQ